MLARSQYKTCHSLNPERQLPRDGKFKKHLRVLFVWLINIDMANPPPPYEDITGITRTVMKDNAQETVANYNGNARPGEMTVNPNTSQIYIGNTNGNLNFVISSNGANLFLGNAQVSNAVPAGFYAMYYNPTTGEVIYYQP
jgi:hypothetical protein